MPTKASGTSSEQKLIGVRVDQEFFDELKGMAAERKMSMNELVKTILSGSRDSNLLETTAHSVRKSLDAGSAVGNDAHAMVQRLQTLISVRDHLDQKREQLNSEKPEGFLAQLFEAEEIQAWRKKAKALELKYRRLVDQIEELEEQVLEVLDEEAEEEPEGAPTEEQ